MDSTRSVKRVWLIAAALTGTTQGQQPLGAYGQWGAFVRDGTCYAITRASGSNVRGADPSASVSYWPRRGLQGQFHIRLPAQQRPGSAVLLRIDGQSFQMVGRGTDAWAPDARADAAIARAMRMGITMSMETRGLSGAPLRARFALNGAASAIEAAALACAPA